MYVKASSDALNGIKYPSPQYPSDTWCLMVTNCISPSWQKQANEMGMEKFVNKFSDVVLKPKNQVPESMLIPFDELETLLKLDKSSKTDRDIEKVLRNLEAKLQTPEPDSGTTPLSTTEVTVECKTVEMAPKSEIKRTVVAETNAAPSNFEEPVRPASNRNSMLRKEFFGVSDSEDEANEYREDTSKDNEEHPLSPQELTEKLASLSFESPTENKTFEEALAKAVSSPVEIRQLKLTELKGSPVPVKGTKPKSKTKAQTPVEDKPPKNEPEKNIKTSPESQVSSPQQTTNDIQEPEMETKAIPEVESRPEQLKLDPTEKQKHDEVPDKPLNVPEEADEAKVAPRASELTESEEEEESEESGEEEDDESEEESETVTTKKITRIIRVDPNGERKEFVYEGTEMADTEKLIEKALADSPYATGKEAAEQLEPVVKTQRRVVLKKEVVKRTVIQDGEAEETTVETKKEQFTDTGPNTTRDSILNSSPGTGGGDYWENDPNMNEEDAKLIKQLEREFAEM